MREPTVHMVARRFAVVFERMGWTWTYHPGRPNDKTPYVPSAYQIERVLRQHISVVANHKNYERIRLKKSGIVTASESGRIHVELRYDETGSPAGVLVTLVADTWEL